MSTTKQTHDCQGNVIGLRADWNTKVNGHYYRITTSLKSRRHPHPTKNGIYFGKETCAKCGATREFEYSFL